MFSSARCCHSLCLCSSNIRLFQRGRLERSKVEQARLYYFRIIQMTSTTTLKVRVEHLRDAFGIGTDHPRLSWIVEMDGQGWRQSAYEIEAYDADGQLRSQTGRIESDQSVLVDWPFEPL